MEALLAELSALVDQQEQLMEPEQHDQWWANQQRCLEIMRLMDA